MRLSSRFHAHPSSRRLTVQGTIAVQAPATIPEPPATPGTSQFKKRASTLGRLPIGCHGEGWGSARGSAPKCELLLADDSGREFQVCLYLLLEKFFRERACFEWAVAVACYWSGLRLLYPMTKRGGEIFSAELNPAVSRLFRE